MLLLCVIVAALLFCAIDGTHGMYLSRSDTGVLLRNDKTMFSWDEAREHCGSEGAVLASPITAGLQRELQDMFKDTFHFIGVESRFRENKFESIEGVALDDMPVADMYEQLNLDDGECLAMNRREIRVVQCTARMPYVCYKNQTESVNITSTTTSDTRTSTTKRDTCEAAGYNYYEVTGSCYKLHDYEIYWDDAANTCSAENGHLVVIEDETEAEIVDLISKMSKNPGNLHIGVRNRGDGGWKSITGKSIEDIYHLWEYGHPTSHAYFCGVFLRTTKTIDNLLCNTPRIFICEM